MRLRRVGRRPVDLSKLIPIGEAHALCASVGLEADAIPEQHRDVPLFVQPRMLNTLGVYSERLAYSGDRDPLRWIMVHPKLYKQRASHPEAWREILAHEVGHAIDRRFTHDERWAYWVRKLGGTPREFADQTVALALGVLKPVARCTLCGHEQLWTKRLRRDRTYHHVQCGGAFLLL